MLLFIRSGMGWWRRRLAWSNSRESWQERVGVAAVIGAAAAIWRLSDRLSFAQEALLWVLLAAALAILLRRGWLKLFGPVLFYDLVRTARRGRYFLIRGLYAGALCLLLFWQFLEYAVTSEQVRSSREIANFAESFFYGFMYIQFLAVLFLTPAFTAGAVAEEKERRTLEFLLATDLRNREIVLSKLAARTGNLMLVVLTGLPILSLTQFLGGIDPGLMLAGLPSPC